MKDRLRATLIKYPRQFWLMFFGMMISAIGASMIWPFLMIYASEKLNTSMATTASLMTLNAATRLVASVIAGPVIDRLGRKWVMVGSLASNGLVYILLSQATTLPQFAILMMLSGAVNPLYRVGADAMLADLVPEEKRVDAYSLFRLSSNVGVAIGPAVGGFLASTSYSIAFFFAATGMLTYSLLLAVFAHETLPKKAESDSESLLTTFVGYITILRDKPFVRYVLSFTMVAVCSALMWVLLPVYAKQNYQIPENLYGFIPTTNAIMVVTLQLLVTKYTKRHPPLLISALGALFYAVSVGSIALGQGFWGFWVSMVIMTIGELILVPTASTYVANLAPADKRGRYMGIYGLTWGISVGLGSLFGGLLNDHVGPQAIWYGGAIVGSLSVIAFLIMAKRHPTTPAPTDVRTSLDGSVV